MGCARLKLVQDLDSCGVLVTRRRDTIGLEKCRLTGLVDAHFATNFPLFGRQICERQGCLLPFLSDTGPIAVLIVEIFAAQRESPLVIDLVVGVTRNALPLGLATIGGCLLLITVVVVEDERELIGCIECSDDVDQVAPSLGVALGIVRHTLFAAVVGGHDRYGFCRCERSAELHRPFMTRAFKGIPS